MQKILTLKESKKMRTYEKMDAYKVSFNATEQVAAAACTFWTGASKYTNQESMLDGCEYKLLDNGSYESLIEGNIGPDGKQYTVTPDFASSHPEWFAMKYRG